MAGETPITIVGNMTRDPEMRQAGNAQVCGFAVAVNERKFNRESNSWEDGPTSFYECQAWRELGQNVAQSLRSGTRVIVVGSLRQRHFEKDGQKQSRWEVEATSVGPSLEKAIAQVQKVQPNQGQQAPQQQQGYPTPGVPMGAPHPMQVPGFPTPQGYPAPGGGYQPPVGPQPGFPAPQTYQPQPGQPGQYGDDTPF